MNSNKQLYSTSGIKSSHGPLLELSLDVRRTHAIQCKIFRNVPTVANTMSVLACTSENQKRSSIAMAYRATTLNASSDSKKLTLPSMPMQELHKCLKRDKALVSLPNTLNLRYISQACSSRDSALWTHGLPQCPRGGKNLHPARVHGSISIKNATLC